MSSKRWWSDYLELLQEDIGCFVHSRQIIKVFRIRVLNEYWLNLWPFDTVWVSFSKNMCKFDYKINRWLTTISKHDSTTNRLTATNSKFFGALYRFDILFIVKCPHQMIMPDYK